MNQTILVAENDLIQSKCLPRHKYSNHNKLVCDTNNKKKTKKNTTFCYYFSLPILCICNTIIYIDTVFIP